jgi:replicative DNA helicase
MSDNGLSTDPVYLEQCITKGLLEQKDFVVLVSGVFEEHYFDSPEVQEVFTFVKDYFGEYKELPDRQILLSNLPSESRENVSGYLQNIDAMDLDIGRHYDWLKDQTNAYLKDKAIKDAVRSSIDIIENKQNSYDIRKLVEEALCRTLDTDIGLDYFGDMRTRLTRMFTDETQRLKTYFPVFDDFINNGFPPKTLSVFVAKIHGFKSNVMANMIARQVMNGHNIALASLEMSEDMFAQRFDGIYSLLDINRFYFNRQLQADLVQRLRAIKDMPNRGNLYIKAFPTGKASVIDFRAWVRELQMRGVTLDGFFFDYLNLMDSEEVSKSDGTYGAVKSIAEETRAMGFEFNMPMISVSQLNRSGTFMSFEDVDFNSIAESMGVPATADFMMIMGSNDDHMVYNNEVHYKIVKNRLGGRVGEMDKFFYDARSMKMYCSSELQQWMEDVQISGDERNVAEHPDPPQATGSRRRRDE